MFGNILDFTTKTRYNCVKDKKCEKMKQFFHKIGGIMKKKSKKFIVGAVLCVVGIIGLLGLFSDTSDKGLLAVGSIALIVAGAVLLFLDKKNGDKETPSAETKADIYAQAEAARKNNEYFSFRVAGVTYNNGRKSRQAILRKIKWGDEPFGEFVQWTVEKYDFEGSPAVGVYANGEQVGNVPKDKLPHVLDCWDRIKSVYHAEVYGGGTDDSGSPMNFGCEITLCIGKDE